MSSIHDLRQPGGLGQKIMERQLQLERDSPYRAVNTLCVGYKNQSVNVV